MSAIAPALICKLESLPQQRLAEVEDFVEFLFPSPPSKADCNSVLAAGD
ncbi:MAG: hypothetical protein IPP18_10235 [Rhodocyclaceae bacterium]|jgi:hypothetical protein|nr:hypothetical protein [Rhodocyclaceae bacterium]MBK6555298.1 hypothetical protein [Rhodocyclaceae bacterium]MBK6676792.1 hypothetical protein [Rhodocyclaceae bacterium]MBK9309419.1 hypothetical protein [Rhodocyclaceae bacterium]MBK9955486.1 hypothetical protein [Rhodocyclaceae bacterium]